MLGNNKSAAPQCPTRVMRARVRNIQLMFCTDFENTLDTWDTGTQDPGRGGIHATRS
jgi:hypothetical protein